MNDSDRPDGGSPAEDAPRAPGAARRPAEFRRYRQALAALYIATWVIGAGVMVASVAAELFFEGGADAAPPPPQDLIACNGDVRRLLEDLNTTALEVQRQARAEDQAALAARWQSFSTEWQVRWTEVDRRCGFERLADTGLGRAYDRTARVHRALPTVQLKYRELLRRFTDELAEELHEMDVALTKSRELLEASSAPGSSPEN